jgi:hypothetical protein
MEENMLSLIKSLNARKLGVLFLTVCIAGFGLTTFSRASAPEHAAAPTGTTIGSDITVDTTWTLAGSPYYVTKKELWVNSGVTLTIEPGAQVLLVDDGKIHVSGGASLIAKGTPGQHIAFARINDTSRWKTINHYAGSTSYYRYADFTWGGGDMAMLHYEGAGTHTLNNCTLDNSSKHGVYAHGSGLNLTVAGTRFTKFGLYGISMDDGAVVHVTGSEIYHKEIKGGIQLRNVGAPSTLAVANSNLLTPAAGVNNEIAGSVCVDAQHNWWNAPSGPAGGGGGVCGILGNSGSGTPLSTGVDWRNYLTSAAPIVGIESTPVASFTVSPDPSVAQPPGTTYTFDASISTDAEDYLSSLDFCWDWEDDGGGCDATTVVATHSYASGLHTARLTVTDTDDMVGTLTQDIQAGYVPTATFTLTQTSWAEIVVDPSASSDVEDPREDLRVRWDWEGDGVWDTGVYSVTDILTHAYDHIGRYWPTLSVEDTDGLVDTASMAVDIIPPAATKVISGSGGTLTSVDGTVQVDVYTDTVASAVISGGLVITHTPWITVPAGCGAVPGDFTYQGFTLAAESQADGQPVEQISGTYTITIAYDLGYYCDVLGLLVGEDLLKLYRWSDADGEWVLVSFTVDSGQLVATTDSFGDFALVLEPHKVYLPLVCRSH